MEKVGQSSHPDFISCIFSCKTLRDIAKNPDVLKKLNLRKTFPPPWKRIPEETDLLHECAKYGNVHAQFLCGLIDYYFLRKKMAGTNLLKISAEASHPEAMYLYGMVLILENQLTEGSRFIKKLWEEKGFPVVRQCHRNCEHVVLEMSIRQYRDYEILLTQIEIGDECVVGEFDNVCDNCFIYKKNFRFLDYMHYV